MTVKTCIRRSNVNLKTTGVSTAETEFTSSKVIVTGTMDADRLVDYVYRRTKKQAKIVPQPEPEKPPEEKPEEKKEEKPADAAEEAKAEEKKEDGEKKDAPEEEKNAAEQGGEAVEEVRFVEEQMMMQRMNHMQYYHQYHYQPLYVMERIPAPQLFSDENPNACNIM